MAKATLDLIRDLVRRSLELVSVEASLARRELSESANAASSGLLLAAAGGTALLGGLVVLLISVAYFLMRKGLAADLSFLIVAVVALAIGGLLVMLGAQRVRPSRLAPTKSLAQMSAIFGGE